MQLCEKTCLPRTEFPEQAGVSSRAVKEFTEDLLRNEVEIHSIMILRHGKVAFETFRKPLEPDLPHTMYSVSKSVTSTAVGFAVSEGLLGLDTRVIDVFPEYRPAKRDENLERLTVFHLLTMTSGKDMSPIAPKSKDRWIRDFFEAKWKAAPGEAWFYVNENTFMLSAILNRLTGMPVVDYLMPRLFEPLGFGRKPFWETDGSGTEAGGWGLYLTTEELAKIMLCYARGGVCNGRQVIPAEWVSEAVKKQVDNSTNEGLDSVAGYGYCFWRNSCPDTYRADGMFSQFGIVFEDLDAQLIVTACEIGEQKTRDIIWKYFPAAFFDQSAGYPGEPDCPIPELPALPELEAAPRSALEAQIGGKIIRFKSPPLPGLIGFPVSMLPLPVIYMSAEKTGQIAEVRFRFDENECEMTWREGLYKNTVRCGMDSIARKSPIRLGKLKLTACCTAAWSNENTLSIWVRPLETVCQRRLEFVFEENAVRLLPASFPETGKILEHLSSGVNRYLKTPAAVKAAKTLMAKGEKLVEPALTGVLGK